MTRREQLPFRAKGLAAAALFAVAAAALAQDGAGPVAQPPETGSRAAPELAPDAAEKRTRRERLAALAGTKAAVLVLAADDSPGFTGSTQNSDFRYLSPFDARGAALLFFAKDAAAAGQGLVVEDRLYLRARNPRSELWTGPVAGPGDETRRAGSFGESRAIDLLAADLVEAVKDRTVLHVSAGGPADGAKLLAPLVASLRAKLPGVWVRLGNVPGSTPEDAAESVRRALPEKLPPDKTLTDLLTTRALDVKPARALLAELREVKSAAEIARIRAATDATVAGMFDAIRAAAPGMLEMECAAYVEFRCRSAGCARQAYPSIVGSGPNSCVLHYADNTRRMQDGDLVVMDIGGEYEGYATDVTRTFPVNGRFTEEQARVYDAVLAAQEAGLAAVKPGATLKDVHAAAAAVLKERGLIQYFPHGTSHAVGLDVHDPVRGDAPMRPGYVLTVEPGAYIAERALGVRIEDTVLVTETGCEVLSRALPKTRDAIEKLMSEPAPYPLPPR